MRTLILLLSLCCVTHAEPKSVLNMAHATSFVVYPADCNHMGTLSGGKTLAEMDRCAGIAVRRLLYASEARRAATVAVKGVTFHEAARTGDLIVVSAAVTGLGSKSVTVRVRVEREVRGGRELVTEGDFVFVALDEKTGKSVEHGLTLEGK